MNSKQMFDYMQTPAFHEAVQRKIEQDRQAGIEWRRGLVTQANANSRLEGYTPDSQLLDLQERFILGELGTDDMLKLVREFAEKAGRELPPPLPLDLGLD